MIATAWLKSALSAPAEGRALSVVGQPPPTSCSRWDSVFVTVFRVPTCSRFSIHEDHEIAHATAAALASGGRLWRSVNLESHSGSIPSTPGPPLREERDGSATQATPQYRHGVGCRGDLVGRRIEGIFAAVHAWGPHPGTPRSPILRRCTSSRPPCPLWRCRCELITFVMLEQLSLWLLIAQAPLSSSSESVSTNRPDQHQLILSAPRVRLKCWAYTLSISVLSPPPLVSCHSQNHLHGPDSSLAPLSHPCCRPIHHAGARDQSIETGKTAQIVSQSAERTCHQQIKVFVHSGRSSSRGSVLALQDSALAFWFGREHKRVELTARGANCPQAAEAAAALQNVTFFRCA